MSEVDQEHLQEAQKADTEVQTVLDSIKNGETGLAGNYIKLGIAVSKIRERKYWIDLGFKSFNAYINSIKDKIDKGRTQIYMVASVAEKLLPIISEDELKQMGISKAIELQKIVTQKGTKVPQELVDKATNADVTREEIRGEVFKHLNQPEDAKGSWWDLKGFYVTEEEKEEIQRGFDVAARVDPIIPEDWPEHARKKEIILRLVREFLSTYEAEVFGV